MDIEALYRGHGPRVLRRCRRLLRNEESAVDAMHDVFVQVLRHEERLTNEAPAHLLMRVATRVCLNRLRTQRRRPEDGDEARVLHAIAALPDAEERSLSSSILRRLFSAHPTSTREIAVLHYLDGLTHEEISGIVGLSVAGVRKRLSRLKNVPDFAEGAQP